MTPPVIVVDTGPLVALADADDQDHLSCVRWLRSCRSRLVMPATIVAEACYMLGSRCGARVEAALLDTLAAGTPFEVSAPTADDYGRMADLVRQYENLPLGGSDAAVIALAERLQTTEIATLDHRHFRVVRPQHVPVFTLVP